jgi:hypothetical protein
MNLPVLLASSALIPAPSLLPDGVYLDLSEDRLLRAGPARATDLVQAVQDGRPTGGGARGVQPELEDRPKWVVGNDRDYGHGFHYLLLEGEEVYRTKVPGLPLRELHHQGRQGVARRSASWTS